MAEEQTRGSSKLGVMSHDDLHKAIGVARESYKIERWWMYGRPAIDRIAGVVNITNPASAGSIIANILKLHGDKLQINVNGFPYGVVAIDGVRLELNMDVRA
jgi:hypothetical protein